MYKQWQLRATSKEGMLSHPIANICVTAWKSATANATAYATAISTATAIGKKQLSSTFVTFWCPQGDPRSSQNRMYVRFELPLEQTKTLPRLSFPWPSRWRARPGTSWRPLGAQKNRFRVGFHFFGVHFDVLVAHGKSRFFEFLIKFWCLRGVPGGVRSGFTPVLSSLWSSRKPSQD